MTRPQTLRLSPQLDVLGGRAGFCGLYPADEEKNDHDHQQQAETAGRVVAPACAIGPSWQGANQQKDEDDQQNCAEQGIPPKQ
jgi:hypothetical protein